MYRAQAVFLFVLFSSGSRIALPSRYRLTEYLFSTGNFPFPSWLSSVRLAFLSGWIFPVLFITKRFTDKLICNEY